MKTLKIFIVLLVATASNYMQAQGLLTNLQGCYPLDCNANNFAPPGSVLDGTPFNVTCTNDRFGNPNSAYQFAGNPTSYIDLPNDVRLKPDTLSFSAWVNFSDITTPQYLVFAKNNCTFYFEGYTLLAAPVAGNFILQLVKSGSACSPATEQVLNGSTGMSANTWYHVGFYMGNDTLRIYLNGTLEAAAPSAVAFNYGNTDVFLGGSNVSYFNLPFSGIMDNVRFWNRKLYGYEFNQLYQTDIACSDSGLLGLLNGLEACYPLDCDANNYGPTISAPPSLDGTIHNVRCDVGHTGVANTAYRFFGIASSYIEFPNDSRIKPGAISFSGWSKIVNLNSGQYIVFTNNGCGAWFEGYALVASDVGGGMVNYSIVKASNVSCGAQVVLTSSGTYVANAWHHVVFFMDANVMKLYVDAGTPDVLSASQPLNYNSDKVYLGGSNSGIFNEPFDGDMDNIRFYSRELTAQEVTILYKHDPGCDETWCLNPADPNCQQYAPRPVGLATIKATDTRIELYPNPAEGKFFLRNGQNKSLVIYDVSGKAVQYTATAVDESTSEINLLNRADGIYFVKISDKEGKAIQTAKLVITH